VRSVALLHIRTGTPNLWVWPLLGGGEPNQLTHFTSGVIWNCQYSADGKLIEMTRGSAQSDVVLFTTAKQRAKHGLGESFCSSRPCDGDSSLIEVMEE